MGDHARARATALVVLVPILSVLSVLFAAGVYGLFTFGFMGLYAFPIYAAAKWYVFLPIVMAFYFLAGLRWQRAPTDRLRYCLTLSAGAALAFAVVGAILLRELDPVSILGTLVGGFVPVFLSVCFQSVDLATGPAR